MPFALRPTLLLAALALTGCSKASSSSPTDMGPSDCAPNCSESDVSVPDAPSLPDLGPLADTSAPTVEGCVPVTPTPHTAPLEVVGDGSAASCTEEALRTAVETVNGAKGGTITFDCGGAHTITLTSALLIDTGGNDQGKLIVIDGGGEITLSGAESTRILDLNHYTELAIQHITLADGFVPQEADGDPANSGAAIRHPWYGALKAVDVRFENNHCASRDGEIGGGAVFAGGLREAVFSGCVFFNNSASNGGGLLNRGSTLTLIDSVFRRNGALSVGDGQYGNGGGVYIDGMNYNDPGDLYVCGTRFDENTAMTHGSGMFAYFYEGSRSTIERSVFDANRFGDPTSGSGALYHQAVHMDLRSTTLSNHTTGEHAGGLFIGSGSSATITNCTFANNEVVSNGGAIFNGASAVDIVNSTFSGNDADYGPAIFKGQSATMSLKNTLFVHNTTANAFSATSCHEPLEDRGGNMQWPETKNNGNADPPCVEDILFADPLLQPLADNGGLGQTMALGAGSPAVGFASDCPDTDQRGEPRGASCDSGAYELQP